MTQGITINFREREQELADSRLDDLQDALDDRKARTRARPVALDTMKVEPIGEHSLALTKRDGSNGQAVLSYHAFGQLVSQAAPTGSVTLLRQLPVDKAADVGSWLLQHGDKADGRDAQAILTRMPDNGPWVARAIVGPNYGLVYDADVLQALRNAIQDAGNGWAVPQASHFPNGRSRYPRLHVNDTGMTVHVIDAEHPIVWKRPDGQDEILYRAIQVRNAETGTRGLCIRFVLVRYDCANLSIVAVLGEHKVYLRHTAGAPDRFVLKAIPAMQRFAALPPAQVSDFLTRMYEAQLADNAQQAQTVLARRGYSKRMAELLTARAEADQHTVGGSPYSAWSLFNAATAEARDRNYIDDTIDAADTAGKVFSALV